MLLIATYALSAYEGTNDKEKVLVDSGNLLSTTVVENGTALRYKYVTISERGELLSGVNEEPTPSRR